MKNEDLEFLKRIPKRNPGREKEEPDPFKVALKEADSLMATTVVQSAKQTVVDRFVTQSELGEAARLDAEAKKLEALGRRTMAENRIDPDAGIPEQVREDPSIKSAIAALVPIVGETRAKAIVYGGLQQGWQPGPAASLGGPTPDPYSEIGKSMFEPVAKALGESMAARITKSEGQEEGRASDEAGGRSASQFDPAEYFARRTKELEAMNEAINNWTQRRDALTGLQGSPTMTLPERGQLGVEIKTIDDYVKLQTMDRDFQIQMFNLSEESKRRWAEYTDEKENSQRRNQQIDDTLALGKEILPTAVSTAQSVIGQRRDATTSAGGPSANPPRIPSEIVTACPSCNHDNVIPPGTGQFNCTSCGRGLALVQGDSD